MTDTKLTERERWLARRIWQAARSGIQYGSLHEWLQDCTYEQDPDNEYVLARDAPPAEHCPHIVSSDEGTSYCSLNAPPADAPEPANPCAECPVCIACNGSGVVHETGDYGAVYGSDWCASCEAGKALAEAHEQIDNLPDPLRWSTEPPSEPCERVLVKDPTDGGEWLSPVWERLGSLEMSGPYGDPIDMVHAVIDGCMFCVLPAIPEPLEPTTEEPDV